MSKLRQGKENGKEALSDHNIHNVRGAVANAEISNGCILVLDGVEGDARGPIGMREQRYTDRYCKSPT